MSEAWTDPANVPRFLQESTLKAIHAGVSWFTWWCSHDLDRRYTFAPLEYSLGLIAQDRKIKPAGRVFHELAQAYRGREVVHTRPVAPPSPPPQNLTKDATWEWLDRWIEKRD